jgi:hypothetical protein
VKHPGFSKGRWGPRREREQWEREHPDEEPTLCNVYFGPYANIRCQFLAVHKSRHGSKTAGVTWLYWFPFDDEVRGLPEGWHPMALEQALDAIRASRQGGIPDKVDP